MATKNPIGNYGGRMDELPFEELFLAPEKKPFYKRATQYAVPVIAGLTMLTGVPDWNAPKHFPKQAAKQPGIADILKMAEAMAEEKQDGIVIYINPVCAVEGTEPGKYERMVPAQIKSVLSRKKGIRLTTIREKADMVIDLSLFYMPSDPRIETGPYESNDSITITTTYIDREGFENSQTSASVLARMFPQPWLEWVANDMEKYLFKEKGYDKRSENDNGGNNGDKLAITIGGKQRLVDRSRLSKAGLNQKVWDGLSKPEEKDYWIKALERQDIIFIEGTPYKILP